MGKKIELVAATDPHSLKEKLEEMINTGWEIKGFVYFNPTNSYGDSYAVLERFSEKAGTSNDDLLHHSEQFDVEDIANAEKPVSPKQANKNINISIGS
jgi:hypothetical protein